MKDPALLPNHNSPNNTVSSNIKVNLQLYVSMNIYFFLKHKAWSKEWLDLHHYRKGKGGAYRCIFPRPCLVYPVPLRAPVLYCVCAPFIYPPFMHSFVDSYQGQDEEICFFFLFFTLTDNLFLVQSSAQTYSHSVIQCSEMHSFSSSFRQEQVTYFEKTFQDSLNNILSENGNSVYDVQGVFICSTTMLNVKWQFLHNCLSVKLLNSQFQSDSNYTALPFVFFQVNKLTPRRKREEV